MMNKNDVMNKNQTADAELNMEQLEDVNGGVIGWVIAGVASGAFFGYQMYKNTKALGSIFCKN